MHCLKVFEFLLPQKVMGEILNESEVRRFDATSFFQFVVVWGAQLLTERVTFVRN